jgi:thiol:disulfide interchange protein DsbD
MRIKQQFLMVMALVMSVLAQSQILTPVKWKVTLEEQKDDNAVVVAKATIDAGWHLYAIKVSNDPDAVGPIATSLTIKQDANVKTVGATSEGRYITHHDPNFDMEVNYFEGTATFKQKVKLLGKKSFKISGKVEYMTCNDEKCIFPDPEIFELDVIRDGEAPATEEPASNTIGAAGSSGMLKPLRWDVNAAPNGDGTYNILFKANLENGWHLYSQHLSNNEGPVPTTFRFKTDNAFELIGETQEGTPRKVYDKNFMMDLEYFESGAVFTQKIKPLGSNMEVECTANAMVCNEESCLPPKDVVFKVNLSTGVGVEVDPLAGAESKQLNEDPFVLKSVKLDAPMSNCGETKENYSLWAIFLLGLVGGLLALVTPCVFPLIPLTVSFFTKGSEGKKGKQRAILYGFFIVMIYFLVSLPFHLSKNVDPEVLNQIATSAWLNVAFFVVFTVFAISFFGFFEITLPSSLANKADNASNVGGLLGIFFMALTLVLVSFSCTGPILGTVIGSIYANDANGLVHFLGLELSLPATKISVAMIGFGISLGLPFALFAAFPSMLKKMPKSGGWLEDFKVSLGFLEVALAVKFLSNADLVQQWGIFKRETFFLLWIIIFAFWTLYLLGIFKFKKGQGSKSMSKVKLIFTVLIGLFTLRMVPGVLQPNEFNRFNFLSGFPPPRTYSWYHHEEEFKIYKDLAEAKEAALQQGKTIFVDFTGWACVNCRKMEENVWPKEKVKKLLEEGYILCSLYVDEGVELPADQQFIYTTKDGRKKEIKTVGNKWATLQTETFNNNSQPYYALLTPSGELLTPTRGYTSSPEEYASWLECGLSTFEASR